MKRLAAILFCLVSLFCTASAEGIEHECTLWLQYGGKWQQDRYLTPLLYSGQTAGVGGEWRQMFRRTQDWTHCGGLYVSGAFFLNKPRQNVIYSLGVQTGWGADYNFQRRLSVKGLNLFLGPYLDFDYAGRLQGISVNKPYSMDMGLSLCLHTGLSWRFLARRSNYRLSYDLVTSALGVVYVPEYWESYYELSKHLSDGFAFASLHNRQTVRHMLALDMQFRHSAWKVGVRHEYVHYFIHGIRMRREEVSLVIGMVFQYTTKIRPFRW